MSRYDHGEPSGHDHGYHSYNSQGYDSLTIEPEPDYDDDTPAQRTCNRRWSVADSFMRFSTSSQSSKVKPVELDAGPPSLPFEYTKPEKPPKHEEVRSFIPKAKLFNGKHPERARSYSPAKNKNSKAKSNTNGKEVVKTKVVTSKSHYSFTSEEKKHEASQNDYYRKRFPKQVSHKVSEGFIKITNCIKLLLL